MNLMLINVSTRKLKRAVRLPEGDLPAVMGDGTSKSAASRRFVARSAERMAEWMASDLSKLGPAGPPETFGRHTPIQRCQVHKARNVIGRLPKPLCLGPQGIAASLGTRRR